MSGEEAIDFVLDDPALALGIGKTIERPAQGARRCLVVSPDERDDVIPDLFARGRVRLPGAAAKSGSHWARRHWRPSARAVS